MTNRVVLGELPGGGMGLRVSRPGHNVLSTSLTDKQLAFDSRWPNTLKIVINGALNIPNNTGSTTVPFGKTVANPFFLVMIRIRSIGVWQAGGDSYNIDSYGSAGWSISSIQSVFDSNPQSQVFSVTNTSFVFRHGSFFDRFSYVVAEI